MIAGLGVPQGGLLGLVQFRFLLFPLPDAERALPFEAYGVAILGGLDTGAVGGGRLRGGALGRVLQARDPEGRLAVDPLLALRIGVVEIAVVAQSRRPTGIAIGLDASLTLGAALADGLRGGRRFFWA